MERGPGGDPAPAGSGGASLSLLLLDTTFLIDAERDIAGVDEHIADVRDAIPVVTYDMRVAEAHARLLTATRKAGRPRGAHGLIIAATALSSGRMVLTADPAGFESLPGVELVHG